MSRLIPFSLLASLLLSACSAPTTRPDSTSASQPGSQPAAAASVQSTPAPNDNLNAVAWTQTAVERDLIYRQTYRMAADELDAALADPTWEALPKGERKTPVADPTRTAVILDIDETVLDNSPYQARLVINGTSFNKDTWAEWCREINAAAIPGALEFTRLAASKGVTVFYLSNRPNDLEDVTLANLRKLDFPIADNEQVFLGKGMTVSGCVEKGSAKSCRRELISRKYRVLLQIGDQLGDLVDEGENTPQARAQAIAPYLDWIGQRWFVLPNPTYGHWEPALFNNDWSQPEAERRRAKEASLRLN
ncbi:MAG TPA: HAD family acid phosphatase [Dokdonella sp.]|uniref:5'-nucleotidase, lipoprotein e(P4) family n=1 Tax=Dokdonella sp. TaxID=2291710 RepID=UPI002D7F36EE|nr:HAD family acid phosphatase [Dokdonella sp.]HET9034409.1 HAD family acid phosphatase [Dokdonella sp.]